MNVFFHTATAWSVIALFPKAQPTQQQVIRDSIVAFVLGLIAHGVLDYIPHCYPIPSKIDAILGSMIILSSIAIVKSSYRYIIAMAMLGSILPDLIDLSPQILNKLLGVSLPILPKIFPWHWKIYSGSLYGTDCSISTLNYLFLMLVNSIIWWYRKEALQTYF